MPYGIYMSAEGAQAQAQRMEIISNNLANAETVGFKRQLAIFQARFAEATQRGQDYPGSGSINDVGGGVEVRETRTDFRQGALRQTNRESDVAIDGDGFFEIQNGNQRLLTKAGNFTLDQNSRLVTQTGRPVLSADGAPIVLPGQGPWHINTDGSVVQQENIVATLSVVAPESTNRLIHAGENMFSLPQGGTATTVANPQVLSGYVEQSTVDPMTEMMQLIEATRAFEANTKLIQHQDSAVGNLLGRVLRAG